MTQAVKEESPRLSKRLGIGLMIVLASVTGIYQDAALKSRDAPAKLIHVGIIRWTRSPAITERAKFNAGKRPDDQTSAVRATQVGLDPTTGIGTYLVERKETPNEARARVGKCVTDVQDNP